MLLSEFNLRSLNEIRMEIVIVEEQLKTAERGEAPVLKVRLDALKLDAQLAQQQFEIDRVDQLERLADELQRKLDQLQNNVSGAHSEIPEGADPDRDSCTAVA